MTDHPLTRDDLRQAAAVDATLGTHDRNHNSPLRAMIPDDLTIYPRLIDDVHAITGVYVSKDSPTEHLPSKVRSTLRRWAIKEGVKVPDGLTHVHPDGVASGRICGRRPNDGRWVYIAAGDTLTTMCGLDHPIRMRVRYTVPVEVEVNVDYDDDALYRLAQTHGEVTEDLLDEQAGEQSHVLATEYLSTLDTHGPVYVRADLDGIGADTVERVRA